MIKKFECNDCGHQFEAEERDIEKCPHCESMNFYPIGSVHRIEKWHLFASFFLCTVVGYFVSGFAFNQPDSPPISIEPIPQEQSPILVESITLSETSLSLQPNNSVSLSATVNPFDADDPSVEWRSSNEDVATVSSEGIVMAVGKGSATITCTALDSSGIGATCEVTVSSPQSDRPYKQPNIPPEVVSKLSTGELQNLINNRDSKITINKHPQVAESYHIKADDGTSYSSFQDVTNKLKYRTWKKVEVKSVSYDSRGRVNTINIHPIKSESSNVEE